MRKTKHFLKRALAFTMAGVVSLGACPFNTQAAMQQTQLMKAAEEEQAEYVLMNIPYDDFYKAEVRNDVAVDAFSSATLNKTRMGTLAAGSYHVDKEGSDITGITYPVKLGEGVTLSDLSDYKQIKDTDSVTISVTNRGQASETTYQGKDALFESDSYSYYILSETPSYYKEITKNADGSLSFGTVVATVTEKKNVTAEFSTNSNYGDYELDLNGDELGLAEDETVSAVVISTENHDYGLRHLENIWQKVKLSWCTGFTMNVHNCPTSSAHYETMMGETIQKLTYYTNKGVYEVSLDADVYVPKKFAYELNVENASVSGGETSMTITGLPNDYQAQYSVDGLADAVISGGKITYGTDTKNGKYTLKVTDLGNVYATISTDFELYADTIPVAFDSDKKALGAASGSTEQEASDYIKNISAVSVNGKSYAASGKGATVIINEDGTINTDAEALAETGSYEMEISATGYLPFQFTYVKEEGQTEETPVPTDSQATTAPDLTNPTETTTPEQTTTAIPQQTEAAASQLPATTITPSTQPSASVATGTAVTNKPADPSDIASVEKGSTYTLGKLNYKVVTANTVAVVSPKNKKITAVSVPATVTIKKQSYKVTAIADNAFANCKNLKKIVIGKNVTSLGKNAFKADGKLTSITLQTTKLQKAGKSVFKGINEKAKIKVPSTQWNNYKKLLKGKGQGNKVKIVK